MIKKSEVESWLRYHENMIGSIQEIKEEEDLSYSETMKAEQRLHHHQQHVEMLTGLLTRLDENEAVTPANQS